MTPLEEALALALKLAPKERLHLIEQLAISLHSNVEVQVEPQQWGENFQHFLNEIGVAELDYSEIEDTMKWLKHSRNQEDKKPPSDWEEDL